MAVALFRRQLDQSRGRPDSLNLACPATCPAETYGTWKPAGQSRKPINPYWRKNREKANYRWCRRPGQYHC
jgi:hypothetical protein